MQHLRLCLAIVVLTLLQSAPALGATGRLICETPGTVQLLVQGSPNAVEAVGELRSLTLPGGQRPLGLREVVPLDCSRATAAWGNVKLIWYCYESENSDPAYVARVFSQDGAVQAVVSRQETGEQERAIYHLQCSSRD